MTDNTNKTFVFEMSTSQDEIECLPSVSRLPPVAAPRRKQQDLISDETSEMTSSENRSSRSYRERLRNRFETVKGKSVRKFKSRNSLTSLAGCVASLRRESKEIDSLVGKRKKEIEIATRSDRTRFFCVEEENRRSDEFKQENETNKSTEVLVEDVKDQGLLVFVSRAKNASDEVAESEKNSFWNPKSQHALSLKDKTTEEPRDLSEEGLYVPPPPKISSTELHITEQRLHGTGEKKWFTPNGNLQVSECPLSEKPQRPDNHSDALDLTCFYKKASNEIELNSVRITKDSLLEINVTSVKFQHHPLFSLEHVLQERLVHLYDVHREFKASNKLERLEKRLDAIRKAKTNLEEREISVDESKKLDTYSEQIKNFRKQLFFNLRNYRENIKNILHAWRSIKKLREINKFSNTSIKLLITKEAQVDDFETKFNVIFKEIIDEHEKEFQEQLHQYRLDLNEYKTTKLNKPSKPIKEFDVEEIRDELRKELIYYKNPNEPNLSFSLNYENQISKTIENEAETSRRNAVENAKISLRFLCDEVEVCKSKPKKLTDNFTCFFEESFTLQLFTVASYITVEIYEHRFNKKKLAEVQLKVPKSDVVIDRNKVQEEKFRDYQEVSFKHAGVGTGRIKLGESNEILELDECYEISGFVNYTLGWDKKIQTQPERFSLTRLNEWIEKTNLDPQDPKNAVIFDYLKHETGVVKENEFFRCDPYLRSLQIGNRTALDENVRFQVLELRDRNEPEFVGTCVPNRLREIPSNVFSNYNRRLTEENPQGYLHEDDYENEITARRSQGRKCLRQMHTNIFQLCRNAENNLNFEDVINEKHISLIELYIKTLTFNFLNWFKFRPNLSKPLPVVTRHEEETLNIFNKSPPKITIDLIDAINVAKSKQTSNVCVEVIYESFRFQSSKVSGPNPIWHEEIKIPLESSTTDYLSPNAFNGSIRMNLYDERNYLGCTQIPLGAISQNEKLEGLFLVQTPAFVFNYETCETRVSNLTYLNLRINIEPNVSKLSPDMNSLLSSEPPYLRDHLLDWSSKYNNEHPKRKFSPMAINTTGKTTCVTRFIKSLEPPQINPDGFDLTPEQCARYVSLIPFTDCNKFYQNMWLNGEQILKLGLGSVIDHAVLLTCYLLTLKLEVWVLLGYGVPNGYTAYVLLREQNETSLPTHFIYDVTTGLKYNVTDLFCPLQKVYCVFNDTNLWGNTQRSDLVSTTRFDFFKRFDWSPLFNNQITAPTNSIQQKLLYVTSFDITNLQVSIEKKIRKKIAKLRTEEQTIWNHYISNALRTSLAKSEINLCHGKKLELVVSDTQINGFVVNLPFSSVNNILDFLVNTGLHMIDGTESGIEFASGVHLHSYPNQILSVWIVFATITQ